MVFARERDSKYPGTDKQPSRNGNISSLAEMISGLINTNGCSSTPTTIILFSTPTCGAARPYPLADFIVTNNDVQKSSSSLSNTVTASDILCSTGFGYVRIGSTFIC